eukprot:scaffold133108_cov15-Tisochrysis_lutea.AAC.1
MQPGRFDWLFCYNPGIASSAELEDQHCKQKSLMRFPVLASAEQGSPLSTICSVSRARPHWATSLLEWHPKMHLASSSVASWLLPCYGNGAANACQVL